MTTLKKKAKFVGRYPETKSPITVQQQFRQKYERDPPSKSCIIRWFKNFQESSSAMDLPRKGLDIVRSIDRISS